MNYFVGLGLGLGLGTALDTLIVTGPLSAAYEFDWGRALFGGLFFGLAGAGLSLLTQKKKRDRYAAHTPEYMSGLGRKQPYKQSHMHGFL